MSDPHSRAVCRIIGVRDINGEQQQDIATGSLVKINGQMVVLTVAHILNPVTVEFFKSHSENPSTLSTSFHQIKSKKSLWKGVNGPDTSDLQVLFLDFNPEDVTPLEIASTNDLTSSLKTIGYGQYYTEREGNVRGVKTYRGCYPVLNILNPALTKPLSGERFITSTQYNPDNLETHTFGGFSGAPVINSRGEIVSIITQGTISHIEDRKRLDLQTRSNFIAAIGLISTYAFGKWPENRFIRLVLGGITVGTVARHFLEEHFSRNAYNKCFHLNLQHASLQSWLNEAVPAVPSE